MSIPPRSTSTAFRWTVFALGLLLGIGLTGWLARDLDRAHAAALLRIDAGWLALFAAATAGMAFAVADRWRSLLTAMGATPPPRRLLAACFLFGRALSYVAPKDAADLVLRSWFLRRHATLPFRRGAYSVVLDRFFDLVIVLAFLAPAAVTLSVSPGVHAAAAWWTLFPAAVISGAVLFGGRILSGILWAYNGTVILLARLPGPARRLAACAVSPEEVAFLKRRRLCARLMAISLIKFGLNALRFVCVAMALPVRIPPIEVVVGLPVAQGAFVLLGVTPAGLGVLEGGWAAAFAASGIPDSDIALFLVGQRIYVMATVFVLAAVALAGYARFARSASPQAARKDGSRTS